MKIPTRFLMLVAALLAVISLAGLSVASFVAGALQ